MIQLGFRIERQGSKNIPVKIRDSGVSGLCVGDEARLWEALQEALGMVQGHQQRIVELEQRCRQLEDRLLAESVPHPVAEKKGGKR